MGDTLSMCKSYQGKSNVCGGTIISSWEVITAAHCVYDNGWLGAEKISVRTGDFTRSDNDERGSSIKYSVRQYRYFPEYSGDVIYGYDFIILEVNEKIELDKYRRAFTSICTSSNTSRPVRAIGIGLTNSVTHARPNDLMEADLVERPEAECSAMFGNKAPKGSEVCVKAVEMKATCSGDSGGPVFVTENGEPKCFYGLVSFAAASKECGERDSPTVFAKISFYFPMMAQTALRMAYSERLKDPTANCGGTLIGVDSIVSAAHCAWNEGWLDASKLQVYSGDGTPNHNDEKVSTQFHTVQYYTYFKEYDGQVINGYDVIIIKLRDPVLFDEFRKPLLVCDETPNGKQKAMKAVGLGYTNSTGRMTQLYEVAPSVCVSKYEKNTAPKGSFICHNDNSGIRDTCNGDSGGPVFLMKSKNSDQFDCLYGAVSYGASNVNCGDKHMPTVASRLSFYHPKLLMRSDIIYNSVIYDQRGEREEIRHNQNKQADAPRLLKLENTSTIWILVVIGAFLL
ncbi:ovochymase-like [Symsagittifera roscoffensis]|uniref:ovochymase-like n=1 Tax=Symsagittifera roscoffensis TaxID=84072 RepID=UPI00307CBC41